MTHTINAPEASFGTADYLLEDITPKHFSFLSKKEVNYVNQLFESLLAQKLYSFRFEGIYLNQDAFICVFVTEKNHHSFYQSIIQREIPVSKVKPDELHLWQSTDKQALGFRNFLKKQEFLLAEAYPLSSGHFLNVFILINEKQTTKKTTKYGAKKTYINYHLFDSRDEANFFLHLLDLKEKKEIKDFSLQPVFLLQEAFIKNDKKYSRIDYRGDFEIYYHDGTTEVIDVKGMITDVFALKLKFFESIYQDRTVKLMVYKETYGGWMELHVYEALKKEREKEKKLREEEKPQVLEGEEQAVKKKRKAPFRRKKTKVPQE